MPAEATQASIRPPDWSHLSRPVVSRCARTPSTGVALVDAEAHSRSRAHGPCMRHRVRARPPLDLLSVDRTRAACHCAVNQFTRGDAHEGRRGDRGDPEARGRRVLFGYPVNHLIESAAAADIRPIIVRQERIGLHMADAIVARDLRPTRSASSACSTGRAPRTPIGGVAQAYSESVPILVHADGLRRGGSRMSTRTSAPCAEHARRHQVGRAGDRRRRDRRT